ncbi:MAG: OmpA family protein [Bacteroidota bacterium]
MKSLLYLLALSSWCLIMGTSSNNLLQAEQVSIFHIDRINTEQIEFAPAFYGEGIVYVARRRNGRIDSRTGETFFELMYATKISDHELRRPRPFSIELNSAYHEGPVCFSTDQREIFFTRSNTRHGLSRSNERGQVGLKIYRAFRGPYDWQGIEELSINDDAYSCMHPSLSADGNRLFFASDRPGGYGGLDLYVSDYINGNWTTAVNLGPKINTSSDEAFPFIHPSGQLFFSSNGHPGQGRLDIFSIDLSGQNWGKVYNLAPPFNSPNDDLSLVLSADATEGYLSSDRDGGHGRDDIYRLAIPNGLEGISSRPTTRELVTVYDGGQSRRLRQAEIHLYELDADSLLQGGAYTYRLEPLETGVYKLKVQRKPLTEMTDAHQYTDREGTAELLLNEDQSYILVVYREGFEPQELRFSYTAEGPSRPLEISLQPSECILIEGQIKGGNPGRGLAGATVQIIPANCEVPSLEIQTDTEGNYRTCLSTGCQFQLNAYAPGFVLQRSQINTTASRMGRLQANFDLVAATQSTHQLLPANTIIVLDQLDWTSLQTGATNRLDILQQLLEDRPEMRVQLAIHTDTRGHEALNLDRSKELAQTARTYLINRGIAPNRLEAIGFGEGAPRVSCTEGINCSEEDHAANNRVELTILQ